MAVVESSSCFGQACTRTCRPIGHGRRHHAMPPLAYPSNYSVRNASLAWRSASSATERAP